MNPLLCLVCSDWSVPGGEKAPDKWAWLDSANQLWTPVSRRHGEIPAPLFTEYFCDGSEDLVENFALVAHIIEKWSLINTRRILTPEILFDSVFILFLHAPVS